jgi:hypothetical protein
MTQVTTSSRGGIVTSISEKFTDWLEQNGHGTALQGLYALQAQYRKEVRPNTASQYYRQLTQDGLLKAINRHQKIVQRAQEELLRRNGTL